MSSLGLRERSEEGAAAQGEERRRGKGEGKEKGEEERVLGRRGERSEKVCELLTLGAFYLRGVSGF